LKQVGLKGEALDLALDFEVGVSPDISWSSESPPVGEPLVWYKVRDLKPLSPDLMASNPQLYNMLLLFWHYELIDIRILVVESFSY
jgi:hypothetical protein